MSGTLIIFTRYPVPGQTKTRLIDQLGPDGAASLHRGLAERTLNTAREAIESRDIVLEIHHTGPAERMSTWLGSAPTYRAQVGGDLGERMLGAMTAVTFPVVLVGTDCPGLTPTILAAAFGALEKKDAVLGPATDGGYYLIGMRSPQGEIFQNITWGSDQVLAQTRSRLQLMNWRWWETETLPDIDRPEDLVHVPHKLLPSSKRS